METEKSFFYKSFWKELAIFLLGIIICALYIQFTSASAFNYDNYILKWQLCRALNMTEINCDTWWSAIAEFPSNRTNSTIIYNNTYYQNATNINETIKAILQDYYNKTEVNVISNTSNQTFYLSRSEFENWSKEFRDNMMNNTASKSDIEFLRSEVKTPDSNNSNTLNIIIWIIIIVVFLAIAYVWYNKHQTNEERVEGTKTAFKKIRSYKELEKEDEIQQLRKQLEESKKKKPTSQDYDSEIEEEDGE
jgi:hypothetical protein